MNISIKIKPADIALSVLLFLSMSVSLLPYGIDKVAILFYLFIVFTLWGCRFSVTDISAPFIFIAFILFYLIVGNFASFVVYPHGSVLFVFYILCLAVYSLMVDKYDLKFLIHVLCAVVTVLVFGIVFWLLNRMGLSSLYVTSVYEKFDGGVNAAISFTTTPQVFATYGSLAMLITTFFRFHNLGIPRLLFVFAIISLAGIALSLNRTWLLYLPLMILFYLRVKNKYIYSMLGVFVVGTAFFLITSDFSINDFGTLRSRWEMLKLASDFFFSMNLVNQYIGMPFYDGNYYTYHGREFNLVENGYFFILINYGYLGLFSYAVFVFLVLFYLRSNVMLLLFAAYYYLIVPLLTHEFYSISIFFVSAAILSMMSFEKKLRYSFA